jgi:N-methylhydantoinase A
MGGTSCDVCVIEDGRVREASGRRVGDRPIALPMLDLHTVGAGGGSIAWADAGGALRVGPHSAGARPGPACYGHGGTEPTVTDANLVLGYLDAESPLAGELTLDREAAERAVTELGERVGLDREACAQGIVDVANAEMIRAVRVMTVERGVDPRELALMPFGGAGPLHAAAIAEELGMTTILCPRASGVLAALGLVVAERRRDVVRSVLTTDLGRAQELGGDGSRVVCELRYRGQAFELAVEGTEDLREKFEAEHERAYGYRDADTEVELVTVRVTKAEPGPEISGEHDRGEPERATRTTRFGETAVVRGVPGTVEGPAIVELEEATLVVPPGWQGESDEQGTIRLWMP